MARSYELTEALSRLVNTQPFFACLLFDLLEIKESENVPSGGKLPTACTDGRQIIVNPKWYNKLTLDERVFVLCHEVKHVIFQHPERGKNYSDRGIGPDLKGWSHSRWNKAGDYVINAGLVEDHIGSMPVGGLYHPDFTSADLVDDVYLRIPDDDDGEEGQGEGTNQDGSQGDGWDSHVYGDPSTAPTKAEIQRAVTSAAAQAKAIGKLPAHMGRVVDEICEAQVNWAEQVKLQLHRIAGRDHATWSRPNRRRLAVAPHVYWPGTESHHCGELAVYEDTSGSVSPAELSHFRGEMVGILTDLNPTKLWVGSCDSEAHDPEECSDVGDLIDYESKGGGGTYMPAIFTKLAELDMRPETLVILTDGYTDFGDPPDYPVIWVITEKTITAPHGTTVHLSITQ